MISIIVVIFLIAMGVIGYQNGLVKQLVTTFSLIITVFLVAYITPHVSEFFEKHTSLESAITQMCEDQFTINMNEVSAKSKVNGTISDIQDAMIDQLMLPAFVKKELKAYNKPEVYEAFHIKNFNEYIPKFIAGIITRALIFAISWILVTVVLYLILTRKNLITELPAINGVNRIFGFFLGVAKGLIFIWIIFLFITLFGGTGIGADALEYISESKFLEFLYDTNMVLRAIQMISAKLLL